MVRRAADGRVIGYQGLVRDDTEPRRMERELREYHEQVRAMAAEFVQIEDRELLLNVARHAGTDAAVVSLRRDERQLSLAVADRGRGFEPSPDGARQGLGFGLFSIGECLSQAGGTFAIESAPGQGTRCVLAVPSSSLG